MQRPPGELVVLEGMSGTGKSTVHERLKGVFPDAVFTLEPTYKLFGAVVRSVYNRQPYPEKEFEDALKYCEKWYGNRAQAEQSSYDGTEDDDFWLLTAHTLAQVKLGMKISELDMQFLFMADRVWDILEESLPKRVTGVRDLKDRYLMSTLAVGSSGGLSVDELLYWQLKAFRSAGIPDEIWKPGLVVVLDCDPEVALARLRASGKVIDLFEEKRERFLKTKEAYLQLAKRTDIFPHTVVINVDAGLEEVLQQVAQEIRGITQQPVA